MRVKSKITRGFSLSLLLRIVFSPLCGSLTALSCREKSLPLKCVTIWDGEGAGNANFDCQVTVAVSSSTCRSFGLSFCESLTDQSLICMQSMVNLVSLTLKKGTEFSAEALKELFEHLHPQRTGSFTGLLHVNVAECTNLNDMAVKALADRYQYLIIILFKKKENMYCVGIKF